MPFEAQPVVTANLYAGPVEVYVDNVLLGATQGGVQLTLATEYGEKTADQSPLLLGSYLKKMRGTVKFKLADLSLENLDIAFGNAFENNGAGSFSILGTHEVKLVGFGPDDKVRTYTIWKGRFSGNTSMDHQIGEQVAADVDIFMESDETKDNGNRYLSFADAM
jgi:hypothetical protein